MPMKFSDGLLKDFPNISTDLDSHKTDATYKFDLLIEMTKTDPDGRRLHNVTGEDIGHIIGEALSNNGNGLSVGHKNVICDIAMGQYVFVPLGVPRKGQRKKAILGCWQSKVPTALPHVKKLLKDKEAQVRRYAIRAIVEIGSEDVITDIYPFIRDRDKFVVAEVVSALGRMGVTTAIRDMLPFLTDEDSNLREEAVLALGRLGAKEAIPVIKQLLTDKEPYVRGYSAAALATLGANDAITDIKKLLNDEYTDVRGWAWIALVELGYREHDPKKMAGDIVCILRWTTDHANRAAAALRQLGFSEQEIENLRADH